MHDDLILAKRAFGLMRAAAKGNAPALLALADEAWRHADRRLSCELAQEALAAAPDDPEIAFGVRRVLARSVPGWHFPMMMDDVRNQAFLEAIERAIRPDMKVLDIGSGSGLLAMMAARAGAREVHSCEMNPAIAAIAKEVVRQNGFADKVTVYDKNSRELDPEDDLGGPVDLVISEIIGKDLVGEKVLPTMRDAVQRLAKPNARFIPAGGDIRIALAHLAHLDDRKVGEVCGFDLSPFNQLRSARKNVRGDDPALTLRGETASLFSFDFAEAKPRSISAQTDLVATGGPVNGIVQWFRLDMDELARFENGPGPGTSRSWALVFFPLAATLDLNPGDLVSVGASISHDYLRIWQI